MGLSREFQKLLNLVEGLWKRLPLANFGIPPPDNNNSFYYIISIYIYIAIINRL